MDTHASHSDNDDVRTLGELIQGIRVAMLVSVAPDGSLVSRPLSTLDVDFDGDLWFFTSAASGKVEDIERQPRVNLAYADPDSGVYVSVVGTAQVLHDRARIDALWHPQATVFFPGGKDDPDLRLLRIRVESAEYWRQDSGLVSQALALMSAVTGSGPQDLGENRALHIRG
jgi:general stress protein 26